MTILSKKIICLFLFVLILAGFIYPLAFNMNTLISGFSSTDEPYGILWSIWLEKENLLNPQDPIPTDIIRYPFGYEIEKKFLYPGWKYLSMYIAALTNTAFAYNLVNILGFILSFIFSFYFVYFLSKNVLSSFFSATIFSLCPYHFVRSWQHFGLAQTQWLPLCLYCLFRLKDAPNFKRMLLFAVSFYLVFIFDFYYAYIMSIVIFLFCAFLFFYRGVYDQSRFIDFRRIISYRKFFLCLISSFLVVLVFTLPTISEILKGFFFGAKNAPGAYNYFLRPFEDLFSQSAKPLSYLLPAPTHPILGGLSGSFLGTALYGDSLTEHALYLGWTALILTFIGIRRWRRAKNRVQGAGHRTQGEDFYINFFVFLAIAAWLFSQPPWWQIGPIKIYMPSFFMYKLLPMFRAYCRFGIIVMLAVSVLAGLGLKFINDRFKRQSTRVLITGLLLGLVLFEFWNWPPYKIIDVSAAPQVYHWLKQKPDDLVIAEYPLDTDGPNEIYKFYQTVHGKKIINCTIPGSYPNRVAKEIKELSRPSVAGVLKWMGVRYVLVHRDGYLSTGLIKDQDELERIPANPGLRSAGAFFAQECPDKGVDCTVETGPIDLYEVVASPEAPKEEE